MTRIYRNVDSSGRKEKSTDLCLIVFVLTVLAQTLASYQMKCLTFIVLPYCTKIYTFFPRLYATTPTP